MIKSELANLIATNMPHLSEKTVADAVNVIIRRMVAALSAGQHVEIRGFASFTAHEAKPRLARNPRTGERLFISARPKLHFKASVALRERVQSSRDTVIAESTDQPLNEEEKND